MLMPPASDSAPDGEDAVLLAVHVSNTRSPRPTTDERGSTVKYGADEDADATTPVSSSSTERKYYTTITYITIAMGAVGDGRLRPCAATWRTRRNIRVVSDLPIRSIM